MDFYVICKIHSAMYSFQGQFSPLEFNQCWLKTIFYIDYKLDKQTLLMTSFSKFKIRDVLLSKIMPNF